MSNNLGNTPLRKKKAKGDRMGEFDRLPPHLRSWLRDADLPWSPISVKRVYLRALKNTGDCSIALAELDTMQTKQISRQRLYGRQNSTRKNSES